MCQKLVPKWPSCLLGNLNTTPKQWLWFLSENTYDAKIFSEILASRKLRQSFPLSR